MITRDVESGCKNLGFKKNIFYKNILKASSPNFRFFNFFKEKP